MSLRKLFALLIVGLVSAPALAKPHIDISGADDNVIANVRNHIGDISEQELKHPNQLRRRLRRLIPLATEALGYYGTRFTLKVDGDDVKIALTTTEPVRWATVNIAVEGEANKLKVVQKKLHAAPMVLGERINQGDYDRYKRELHELCQEYGFLDAHYKRNELHIDLTSHRADATLRIDCGTRYHFGAIEFSDSSLNRDLLQRLVPIPADAPFRKRKLSDLYRNLQNSHYFGEIDIATVPDKQTHLVAIKVALKDAPSHRFKVGAGYGTDTGPRARFGWERPVVNSAGHSFSVETEISKPIQTLKADYRIPLQRPLDQFIDFPAEYERKIVEDTDSALGKVGMFYNDRYGENWRGRYGADFEVESYQQGSEPRKTVRYLLPSTTFTELELPEGIDPLSGHKTWLEAAGSIPALGADTAFLRLRAGYKRLFGLGGSQLLVARAEAGAIATDDINQIPASQRFFTGGDATVRGFDFESLSTVDANGELIGGRYLNVASADYSVKVASEWRAAVFVDAGRAFNTLDEPWHKAFGFGVRWLSPVGQIRIDLAFPINEPERSWRLHIFMGPPL